MTGVQTCALPISILLEKCKPAIEQGAKVSLELPIKNTHRVVGTILGNEITKKHSDGLPDGTIDIAKAINVNEQFQVTRQFWTYAHENGILTDVRSFLNPVPHVSYVQGAANVDYLRRRRETLVRNPLFASMEFIDDADEFAAVINPPQAAVLAVGSITERAVVRGREVERAVSELEMRRLALGLLPGLPVDSTLRIRLARTLANLES